MIAGAETVRSRGSRWQERVAVYRQNALPSNPSAAENLVIKLLREWEQDARLDISAMRTRWQNAKGRAPVLEIRLTGAGDLAALTRFLYEAETAAVPLRTVGASVSAASGKRERLALELELEAVLWGPEPADDGAGIRERRPAS